MESDLDPLMISYDDDSKRDPDLRGLKSTVKSMISDVLKYESPERGFVFLRRSIKGNVASPARGFLFLRRSIKALSSLNQKVLEQILFFKANKPSAKWFCYGRKKTRKYKKSIALLADQYIDYSEDLHGFVAELLSFQKKAQESCRVVKTEVGKYFDYFQSITSKKRYFQSITSKIKYFQRREDKKKDRQQRERVTKVVNNLKACKNTDEPSTNKLFEKLIPLQNKQETMLTTLRKQKEKRSKRLRKAKKFLFMGTVASMLIAVIVTAALGAVPVAGLIAALLPFAIDGGRWLGPIVIIPKDSVNYKVDLIKSMLEMEGVEYAKRDLDTIKCLIYKVEIQIDSLLLRSSSIIDEEQIESEMKRIDHQMEDCFNQLQELKKETDTFSKQILEMKEVTRRHFPAA